MDFIEESTNKNANLYHFLIGNHFMQEGGGRREEGGRRKRTMEIKLIHNLYYFQQRLNFMLEFRGRIIESTAVHGKIFLVRNISKNL